METLIYRRTENDWISGDGTNWYADRYWRNQAREIFRLHGSVDEIEIVRTGRKTDSTFLRRGARRTAPGQWVIVTSADGKFSMSRRDYRPD